MITIITVIIIAGGALFCFVSVRKKEKQGVILLSRPSVLYLFEICLLRTLPWHNS